jgi:hypothetical protein
LERFGRGRVSQKRNILLVVVIVVTMDKKVRLICVDEKPDSKLDGCEEWRRAKTRPLLRENRFLGDEKMSNIFGRNVLPIITLNRQK